MRRFAAIGLMVVVCAGISAQKPEAKTPVPANERTGFATIQQSNLRADLSYVASDELEGRLSLQPGDENAARWVARQFVQAGLRPISNAGGLAGYMQPFELIEYKPDRAEGSVTLTRDGKKTVWHAPQAFGAYKHAVDLTAPVVFAGYGITAPELGYDDYKGIDAKGKIVFVFDHEPQEDDPKSIFNGTGNTRYATTRVKLMNAQAHGAVALVVVAEPNRKHLTNAERAGRIGGGTQRVTPLPIQAIADDEVKIPAVTVQDAVETELLATSGTTGSELQSAIDKDLSNHSVVLPDMTLTLHMSNTTEKRGFVSNVAGLLLGSDPTLTAETVIIADTMTMMDGLHARRMWVVSMKMVSRRPRGRTANKSGMVRMTMARAQSAWWS